MKAYVSTLAVLGGALLASAANAAVFTDSASFMAQVAPGSYTEDFNLVADGGSPAGGLDFGPTNGFAYNINAAADTLFNDAGRISTNVPTDQIVVTFTGAAVTAVGGNFWGTDIGFGTVLTDVTINLSDGTVETFASSSPSDFRGFTSNIAITSLIIDAADLAGDAWATMDNLIVGQAVPAPGAAALLVMFGATGLTGRKRRR